MMIFFQFYTNIVFAVFFSNYFFFIYDILGNPFSLKNGGLCTFASVGFPLIVFKLKFFYI